MRDALIELLTDMNRRVDALDAEGDPEDPSAAELEPFALRLWAILLTAKPPTARSRFEKLAVQVFALEQRLKSAIGTGDKNVERLHEADEHATRRAVELDNRVTLHDRSIEKLCERLGILSARVTDIEEKDRAREVEKVAVLDRLAEDIAVDEIRKHCAVLATELRNPDPARGWVASELDKLARGGGGETP